MAVDCTTENARILSTPLMESHIIELEMGTGDVLVWKTNVRGFRVESERTNAGRNLDWSENKQAGCRQSLWS